MFVFKKESMALSFCGVPLWIKLYNKTTDLWQIQPIVLSKEKEMVKIL